MDVSGLNGSLIGRLMMNEFQILSDFSSKSRFPGSKYAYAYAYGLVISYFHFNYDDVVSLFDAC